MKETWNVIFLNETGDQFAAGFGRLAESSAAGSVTRRVILRIRILLFPELPGRNGDKRRGAEKRAADYALSILEEARLLRRNRRADIRIRCMGPPIGLR